LRLLSKEKKANKGFTLEDLKRDLGRVANKKKAVALQRYFKTGPGEYGEGDLFLGIPVPELRKIAKRYRKLEMKDIELLLHSKTHEERLVSLMILVDKYERSSDSERVELVEFYLDNTSYVNNWDLVDLSAPNLLRSHVSKRGDRSLLYALAGSENMWERRMSLLATLGLIRNGEFEDALKIAKLLLKDESDLVQKALGWMLREVGNRDMKAERDFLDKHRVEMNRTALRYAIEKFPEKIRLSYLS
jgi:3-methyladenine DNA glycosylase AlkD